MTWLLTLILAAPPQHAIIWGEGSPQQTNLAVESWFAARDARRLPAIELRPGYPKSIANRALDAPPGGELAVLGICDAAMAGRIAAALRGVNPNVRSEAIAGAPITNGCPQITPTPANSVVDLLARRDLKSSAAAERTRARVGLCSFGRAERRERFGEDYLCKSLWGLPCVEYARLMLFGEIEGDPCSFLVGAESKRIIQINGEREQLLFCDAQNAAFVFAHHMRTGLYNPIAILCGQGPGYATELGRVEAVGTGACIEYVRSFEPGGLNAGLLCYTALPKPPYAVVDRLPIVDERGLGRYGIAEHEKERIICLERGALRFTGRGLVPIEPTPASCAAVPLRLPLREVRP